MGNIFEIIISGLFAMLIIGCNYYRKQWLSQKEEAFFQKQLVIVLRSRLKDKLGVDNEKELEKLKDFISIVHSQNLNGRETPVDEFEKGIEATLDEVLGRYSEDTKP